MGNHEYCVDCGEDNFHIGQPCNPIKVKEKQDKERKDKQEKDKCVIRMRKKLDKLGIKYELDENGHAVIRWWYF